MREERRTIQSSSPKHLVETATSVLVSHGFVVSRESTAKDVAFTFDPRKQTNRGSPLVFFSRISFSITSTGVSVSAVLGNSSKILKWPMIMMCAVICCSIASWIYLESSGALGSDEIEVSIVYRLLIPKFVVLAGALIVLTPGFLNRKAAYELNSFVSSLANLKHTERET